jgi:hypothetical protein
MTGIAFRWTRPTSAFGSQVRNAKMSVVIAFLRLAYAGPVGPEAGLSSWANHTGTFLPSMVSYSLKEVNGTRQRCSGPASVSNARWQRC